MPSDKLRMRFSKVGPLRLLSHHDTLRCLERIARRAELPFRSTQGFHPSPRIILALSLPLGVDGLNEVLELELLHPMSGDEVVQRLNHLAPDGLSFHGCREIPLKQSATVCRAIYTWEFDSQTSVQLQHAIPTLLAQPKIWVERMHPSPRRTNIRPYLRDLTMDSQRVVMDLWVTAQGTARGDELVRLLGLTEPLNQGRVLTRADLILQDEATSETSLDDEPPSGPPEIETLSHVTTKVDTQPNDATRAVWGVSPHGPVVE